MLCISEQLKATTTNLDFLLSFFVVFDKEPNKMQWL